MPRAPAPNPNLTVSQSRDFDEKLTYCVFCYTVIRRWIHRRRVDYRPFVVCASCTAKQFKRAEERIFW